MKELCVVHLVRASNGIEPFASFLESYRQSDGGIDHDLLIVFKGFNSPESKEEYLRLLDSIQCRVFDVPDTGFDITAYFACAKQYKAEYRYFCFLNSFSVIQDREWLSKLYTKVTLPGVGAVGATGSWQSHRTSKFILVFAAVALQHYRLYEGKAIWKRWILATAAVFQLGRLLQQVKPFPNYHLRTNAFIISSETMMKVECHELVTKFDAHRFESERRGLTQQILDMGKEVLVVGKDGIGYAMTQWDKSNTFWQSEQENLLVADNQTKKYKHADTEVRLRLSVGAWGNRSSLLSGKPK